MTGIAPALRRKPKVRRKAKKAPRVLERDVTREIRSHLDFRGIWHWKVWQGLGSKKGVSDLLGIYRGRPLAVEIKAPDGDVSEDQMKFLQRFQDEGGIAIVARSLDVLKQCLEMADEKFGIKSVPF